MLSRMFVIIFILHGLIHLMSTITFHQSGTFEELSHKTTLLDGRWDVGPTEIRLRRAVGVGSLWFRG